MSRESRMLTKIWLLNLAYIGAPFLAGAVLSLGVGLIRAALRMER